MFWLIEAYNITNTIIMSDIIKSKKHPQNPPPRSRLNTNTSQGPFCRIHHQTAMVSLLHPLREILP